MKRFRFPLARLERVRELRRRQARVQLARAIAEVRRWRSAAEVERGRLEESLRRGLPPEIAGEIRAMKQQSIWLDGRRSVIREARVRESAAVGALSESRTAHNEFAREHRVVERLREKRFRRWLEEVEQEERKFLDEIHLLRMVRERGRHDGKE